MRVQGIIADILTVDFSSQILKKFRFIMFRFVPVCDTGHPSLLPVS
jgi:hypothetical protein